MHNPGDSGAVGSLTLLREVGGPVHMQDKPHLVLPRCTYVYLSEVWSSIKWVGPTLSPRVSVSAHYWNCIQSISQVLMNYVCNFSSQTGWRRSCKLHQKVRGWHHSGSWQKKCSPLPNLWPELQLLSPSKKPHFFLIFFQFNFTKTIYSYRC